MPFSVDRLTVLEIKVPLRFAFKHAAAVHQATHHLLVIAHAGDLCGYGEIAPRSYVTGESVASCRSDVAELWWPKLKELHFTEEQPFSTLRPLYEIADSERKTASYAGIDVAIFDLWARVLGIPGHALFGRSAPQRSLTGTIGFGMPAGIAARGLHLLGCLDFKVKVGAPDDYSRLKAVRRAIGKESSLRIDANGAWTETGALKHLQEFAEFNLAAVEEPVANRDIAAMARLQVATGLSVMADESLCTSADAKALIAANAAQYWNLRLAKVGGFSGVKALLALAERHAIRCQLGPLVGETAVLGAAARAAAALGEFTFQECAFAGWLPRVKLFHGLGAPLGTQAQPLSTAPGLGLTPTTALKQVVAQKLELT